MSEQDEVANEAVPESLPTTAGSFPWPHGEVEERLRKIVAEANEFGVLDRKRTLNWTTAEDQAEFAKTVAAIANTEEDFLGGWGVMIVGADQSSIVGGVDEFHSAASEKLRDRLEGVLKKYLVPPPRISVICFEDPEKGRWGAVFVRPSSEQPHLIQKEHAGNTVKHEVWVRVLSNNSLAQAHHYARFFEKRLARATEPLLREVVALQTRIGIVESRESTVQRDEHFQPAEPMDHLSRVRRAVRSPQRDLAEILFLAADSLWRVMNEDTPELPWVMPEVTDSAREKALVRLETASRPLIESVCMAVDRDPELAREPVVEAVRVLARRPGRYGAASEGMHFLRSYPLALLVQAIATMTAVTGDGLLLNRVLTMEWVDWIDDRYIMNVAAIPGQIITEASHFFEVSGAPTESFPVSRRTRETLSQWIGRFTRGDSSSAPWVGEFLVGLACLALGGNPGPLPATYLADRRAVGPITRFLRQRPQSVASAFGESPEQLMKRFDNAAQNARGLNIGHGFHSGALAAWNGVLA